MAKQKDLNESQDVWDKSVQIEESSYYWNGKPIIKKGSIYKGKSPVVVELFSGCGGTSMGFEMAGFHIALGVDIHRPSVETFQNNHPNASTILGDMKKVTIIELRKALPVTKVDVLIAGVPCQGFSLNNRKRQEGDKRNLLYKEFIRAIKVLKPHCIVLENVSGMMSTGNFRAQIEKDLSKASGMIVKSKLLNAADYGVPQRRQRLVFVGIKGDKPFDFDDIKQTHGPGRAKPYTTIKDAIGDLPALKSGEEAFTYLKESMSEYQKLMRKGVSKNSLTNHRSPKHPADTLERIKSTKPGQPMYPAFKQRIRLAWDIQSPTQVAGGIRPQFQFGHPRDIRGLTIRERCRIQSFPDSFVVTGGIVQGRVQTGNAVPPLLAKALAEAIKKKI
ncbi:DNA cytosine methyltransferase [Polynucleobacter paneuropaeus]|nr:DNA cytosine methyltransferase [Polynucleobacter paneuropaeus]